MAQYRDINCPSCGAPGQVDRFAAMAVCEYCQGAFYFKDEAVLNMGTSAVLAESPSPLYVGATGTFRKQRFTIMGRIRYRYSQGLWDEWYLRCDDGDELWVGEDEMEFSLMKEVDNPGAVPPFEQIEPGMPLSIGGHAVSVDELDEAEFEGAEGSLPFVLALDRTFPYFDASAGDLSMTVEYVKEGLEVFIGEWIDAGELALEVPKEYSGADDDGWADA